MDHPHPPNASSPGWPELDEEPGFFQRHKLAFSVTAVVALGAAVLAWKDRAKTKPGIAVRHENRVIVNAPPPPPPPPPPPVSQPPPPPQEKMVEQVPVENQESKPEPKADEPPPVDIGTGIKGDGSPDGFGLSGRGTVQRSGGGTAGNPSRSRWGWYAAQVQSRIQQAVRSHPSVRTASLRAEIKVWADSSGRITRAKLASSTGSSELDNALKDQVFTGLTLSEPPPDGMPMPIVLRITARRPN